MRSINKNLKDWGKNMLKKPQIFMKVGPNKYVPVEQPWPNYDIYIWDDDLKQIILYKKVEEIR